MQDSITLRAIPGIGIIAAGDDLAQRILNAAEGPDRIRQGDIVVIAQKVVSKAENRFLRLADIVPSSRARELAGVAQKDPRLVEAILAESHRVVRCVPGVIIVEDRRGLILANAGIDASNVGGPDQDTVLLLPENPDASAAALAARFTASVGSHVAVIINDSIGRAWRNGTVGTAIGACGVTTLLDRRGEADLFGRRLQSTEVGIADEIAAAASLVMGQAAEGQPVVLVRGLGGGTQAGHAADLLRDKSRDLFR